MCDKFQVLVGAQVYEQKKATYAEINECLSLWKLRHVEFMTARDDAARPDHPSFYHRPDPPPG